MIKRSLVLLYVFIFLNSLSSPVHAYTYIRIPEYLCELGVKFYQQGRYDDALTEFKKILVIQPDYEPAQKYIRMIEEGGFEKKPGAIAPKGSVKEFLEQLEHEGGVTFQEKITRSELSAPFPQGIEEETKEPAYGKKVIYLPQILNLDQDLSAIKQPIEIEIGKSIRITARNIQRFLLTEPDTLVIEKKGSGELLVTGKNLGYAYLHIWDEQERKTLEFLIVSPRPEGPTVEEEMLEAAEKGRNFRLRYYLNWSSFETGRRLNSLNRITYSWSHSLNLYGETPYGDLDSGLAVRSLKETTDVTYFSLGLKNGRYRSFKDFSLYGFDFIPNISNIAFGGRNLRGAMFYSPAFNKKLDYTAFWGREGGGKYGGLSPGIEKAEDSFLSGIGVNFYPWKKQNYNLSAFRGWGSARPLDLNEFGYDFNSNLNFDKWGLGWDAGYDSNVPAYLLNTNLKLEKFSLNSEFRDIDKDFKSMTGQASRSGELGLLNTLSYQPLENFLISSRLDLHRDRLFPNPNDPKLFNEDFDWSGNLRLNRQTSVGLSYALQNDLGKISPFRSQSIATSLQRIIYYPKKINTYLNYRYNINENFNSSASDYLSNKVSLGMKFNLIGDLAYFLDKDFNWVKVISTDEQIHSSVFQTGVDWHNQIFDSPFYGDFRLIYRDEEDTDSSFSFLSGEDYIEGYSELSYRPKPDVEAFANTRVRNIWAEKSTVQKHMDVSFNAGMRYTWDTGVRWESSGDIEGYVFKDFNADGLRQRDEPPIEGIKIWVSKDKNQVTDMFGYYKFKGVRARKAYVIIDSATVPSGFVLTVPSKQEAVIQHGRSIRLNFGFASRTEINGIIFEDADGNGRLDAAEKGIKGVTLTLENGSKVVTDIYGRYVFSNVPPGEHKLTLNLESLPSAYIPTVPIFKDLEIQESMVYPYNIPLKKTE